MDNKFYTSNSLCINNTTIGVELFYPMKYILHILTYWNETTFGSRNTCYHTIYGEKICITNRFICQNHMNIHSCCHSMHCKNELDSELISSFCCSPNDFIKYYSKLKEFRKIIIALCPHKRYDTKSFQEFYHRIYLERGEKRINSKFNRCLLMYVY